MVGIDTASIDHGQTRDFPTHRRLFRDNVPALENVANLDKLPAARLHALRAADENRRRQRRTDADRRGTG